MKVKLKTTSRGVIMAILFLAILVQCSKGIIPDNPDEKKNDVGNNDDTNENVNPDKYQAYFGTTHGHTSYSGDAQQNGNTPGMNYQEAINNGYQFYIITDHSQYDSFTGESWEDTKKQAENYLKDDFVSLYGFEYSENNGPGGKGHINAINTTGYLNALAEGMWLDHFYGWLVDQSKKTKVVASFNHPALDQYNNWDYFSAERREVITMLEVINGLTKSDIKTDSVIGKNHYDAWLVALSKGWRVSPVAGLDAHSPNALKKAEYRTGIWAAKLTKDDILDAMANRRTFATYDRNLKVFYWVNGQEMGTVLENPSVLRFKILASDPDTDKPKDKIRKIEIIGGNDKVVASKVFDTHDVEWEAEVPPAFNFYLLKVYTQKAASNPMAYAAPVWITK